MSSLVSTVPKRRTCASCGKRRLCMAVEVGEYGGTELLRTWIDHLCRECNDLVVEPVLFRDA